MARSRPASRLRPLGRLRIRSNPDLVAVARDQCSAQDRAVLESLSGGDELAVALRSMASGELVKLVDHETRLLLHAFRAPARSAGAEARLPRRDRDRVVARLVCDGLLQVETDAGEFVHGVRAYAALFRQGTRRRSEETQRLRRLSRIALEYVARIPIDEENALARRLYHFNLVPRSRAWERVLGEAGSVARWLGLESEAEWVRRLGALYAEHGSRAGSEPWIQWSLRGANPTHQRCKIYVSPEASALPAAFRRVAEVCTAMAVPSFKVGATLACVLRPDKLVLYVDDERAVQRAAQGVLSALRGTPAHGVPFTAPCDRAGLVSWGVDPRPHPPGGFPEDTASWRWFVADRLAKAVASAKDQDSDEHIVPFALERLRLEGIDPDDWRSPADWRPS